MIRFIKYLSLGTIVFNLPTFFIITLSSTLGAIFSALMFFSLLIYAIIEKEIIIINLLLIAGFGYFLISGIQFYVGDEREYFIKFIKYFWIIIIGTSLAARTSKDELLVFLSIGAFSIFLHAIIFSSDYGRYSGFYLDPNTGGLICLMGYGLAINIANQKIRLPLLFLFTFAGIITFSRTFIVIWLIINFLSLRVDSKNYKIFGMGIGIVILIISLAGILNFNTTRFSQLQAIVNNEQVTKQDLNKGGRTETWSKFYPYLSDKPFFGHGYRSFQGRGLNFVGSHNSFMMIYGESGIFVLLLFICFYLHLFYWGLKFFKEKPYILFLTIVQILFLLTNHNYYTNYYLIFISLWLHIEVNKLKLVGSNNMQEQPLI
ncbi:O-antigen ligase family protein [Aquimarina sp. ERC-38]|uniref:O-antigen ligase family protein n=1 Tax=Aquimarina sp. ERC-38 TaxID=2949996 RepID=UPI0022453B05|nr:O-antigen ligase family protein [Aquimarina sp. ERC-38]UZO80242.1 O-antigen ligase family protein [Aquimarina sp. ERC-38]